MLWIIEEHGAVRGMMTGKGTRSTLTKPVPIIFCPLQIPHDMPMDQTRTTAVGKKTIIFIVTAMRISNLTILMMIDINLHFYIRINATLN
jgi:hypothetical protein